MELKFTFKFGRLEKSMMKRKFDFNLRDEKYIFNIFTLYMLITCDNMDVTSDVNEYNVVWQGLKTIILKYQGKKITSIWV